MRHPCRLFTADHREGLAFEAVAYLADHLHQARGAEPLVLTPGLLTCPDYTGPCVVVRYAGGLRRETLGYAVIGETPPAAGVQLELLSGPLARLNPDRQAA